LPSAGQAFVFKKHKSFLKPLNPGFPVSEKRSGKTATPESKSKKEFSLFSPTRKPTNKTKTTVISEKEHPAIRAFRRSPGFGKAAYSASGFSLGKTLFRFSSKIISKATRHPAFPKEQSPERPKSAEKNKTCHIGRVVQAVFS